MYAYGWNPKLMTVKSNKLLKPGMVCMVDAALPLCRAHSQHVIILTSPDSDNEIDVLFLTNNAGENHTSIAVTGQDVVDDSCVGNTFINVTKQYKIHQSEIISSITELTSTAFEKILRASVLNSVARYSKHKYQAVDFNAGETAVAVSGKVLGASELTHLVESSLDGWLTTGRFNQRFEQTLADFLGVKHVLTTNSGSSANLLALTALTSPKLGDRALQKGDEVISVAAGFPTTVNPIIQNGLIPVFVDIAIPGYNIDVSQLKSALSEKTKAIMLAHTLGNAFNLDEVIQFAREHRLWIIEDCCDALGTTYTPTVELTDYRGQVIPVNVARHVGTFGDIATLSFYPAHHITMGEGGAIFTNNGQLKILLESFRDWGRDCFCEPGQDNTCKKRFDQQLGQLPCGYDHKYTYSHIGYNLKITDMQAAVALAQMERLPAFIEARKHNFTRLYNGLAALTAHLILPEAEPNSSPSWFGFALTLKQRSRNEFIHFLESKKIASRLLFGGNLTKQPYMRNQTYRMIGPLDNTDYVMNNTLWIGVYPGINDDMIDYMIQAITDFFG